MISPRIFDHIRQEGKFSIIDTYLDLAPDHKIGAFYHDESCWMDVGKPETLQQAVGLVAQIELAAS